MKDLELGGKGFRQKERCVQSFGGKNILVGLGNGSKVCEVQRGQVGMRGKVGRFCVESMFYF